MPATTRHLVTSDVFAGAQEQERGRFRSLDRMQLRGRVEPVHVYLVEGTRRFGDTAATAFGDIATPVGGARRHPPRLDRT